MNPLLDAALDWLARGASLLPVHAGNERDKDPHAGLLMRTGYTRLDDHTGQTRASWKPLQLAAPSEETVRAWFSQPEGLGMALVTGQISDRIVIDFDGDEGRAFAHDLGIQPHVRTGGGYHWHLKAPPYRVRNLVGKNTTGAPDCVDVRGDGGNAILPPTCTRKGPYQLLRDPDDLDDLNALPVDLQEALRLVPPVMAALPLPTGPLPEAGERYPAYRILDWARSMILSGRLGGRNDVGYTLAWALFNNGYTHPEVIQIGQAYVAEVGYQGEHAYTFDEFQASMRTAYQAPRGEPWGYRNARETARSPMSAAEALEDIFPALGSEEQARAAQLLAHEWWSRGQPLEDTVTYLRLIGHPDPARASRQAYRQAEAGQAPVGTLEGFLQGRRVKFGRGG